MALAVGASHIAERNFALVGWAEFPYRSLTLGIGVGGGSPEEAHLLPHGVLGRVLGVIGHHRGLGIIAENTRALPEGGGGAQQTKRAD